MIDVLREREMKRSEEKIEKERERQRERERVEEKELNLKGETWNRDERRRESRRRAGKRDREREKGKKACSFLSFSFFFPQSKVNVDLIHFFRSAVRWTCCIGVSVYARLAFSLPVPW